MSAETPTPNTTVCPICGSNPEAGCQGTQEQRSARQGCPYGDNDGTAPEEITLNPSNPAGLSVKTGSEEITEPSTERGAVTWESSDDDSGPDVGMCVGLGDGKLLRVGELSDRRYAEAGEAAAALGSAGGWWLMVYPGGEPLAKFCDAEAAATFFDTLGSAIRG